MADFNAQKLQAKAKINSPLGLAWIGFNFWFDPKEYVYLCSDWPYPTGYRHGQIYNWHNVKRIPSQGVYVMENTVSIKRVSDNAVIPAKSIDISLNWCNWCWSLSFEVGKKGLALIKPTINPTTGIMPTEIEININGYIWRFYVERWNETRSFASDSFTVSGRGITAELDEPYALKQTYLNEEDTSAKQLAENILANTGWTLDWQIEDWLIKANAFSLRDTPIRALARIAQAQDAIMFGDMKEKVIHFMKRYKVKTWNLAGAVPDKSIPPSVMKTLSQQFIPQPVYNGVYVVGTSQHGVSALVKKAGTNGEPLLEQITDDLFTDTIVVLERGKNALCMGNGPFYKTSIILPLFDIGLLRLGEIIEMEIDGQATKGIVSAVRVMAEREENGVLKTAQTVEVVRWQVPSSA